MTLTLDKNGKQSTKENLARIAQLLSDGSVTKEWAKRASEIWIQKAKDGGRP